ncbi:cell wall hydrolase [Sphingomonas gellani]|uniref:cell wall hydrolase n=1 Tax=Sphingomonas gellani TaxID=1166340 RepID=UPI001FCD1581|nr:cell wall hydrolase [Sphingomonas gellani]
MTPLRIGWQAVRVATWSWLVAVVIGLSACVLLAAGAAIRAMAAHHVSSPTVTSAAGYEADDHFPGAALLYAAAQAEPGSTASAAPATGVTGTIALPSLPVPVSAADAIIRAEAGVLPARPFSLLHVAAVDRGRALQCLTQAIYYEAASEPLAGQEAVAQVVLNRVRHPAFPATVCGVVYQGSERAHCQFSFACDGAMRRVPEPTALTRAARVAAAALAGFVYAPVGLATHYHTYAVTPAWNRTLVFTDMVGAHLFHRWKGYWGTSAAFTQVYRGGEPVPGPNLGAPDMAPLLLPILAANGAATSPVVAANAPAPLGQAHGSEIDGSGTPQPDRLPAASTILDKWKDVGTLR